MILNSGLLFGATL